MAAVAPYCTENWQFAFGASVAAAHVPAASLKAPTAPVTLMLLIVNAAVSALVTVNCCVGPSLPTVTLPKPRLCGLNDTYREIPWPETVTTCGELAASSLNVRFSAYWANATGVNETPTVQLFPAATVALVHELVVTLMALMLPP